MKKLLFILFIFIATTTFAQQNISNNSQQNKAPITTIVTMAAYPNPFTTKTQINFTSTITQGVVFTIKNLLGKTVYMEKLEAKEGKNTIQYNRNNLPQGMYIYSLQTDSEIISKRLIIR